MSLRSIQSRDNAQYKALRQLASNAQARKKSGRTLLEGIHLCDAWLQHRGAPLTCVVSDSAQTHPEVVTVIDACRSLQVPILLLPDALFSSLSQVDHGIGLLFVIDTPVSSAPELLAGAAVLLDGVQDPGNLGSILRTTAAAGIRLVCCGPGTVLAWSPKVLRAGMGAHFVLDIRENIDLQALVASATVPVFATGTQGATSLHAMDLRSPCAWLFGNEGRGIASSLLKRCTQQVYIPQQSTVESLNVAASAAICLFEQVRQQGTSP